MTLLIYHNLLWDALLCPACFTTAFIIRFNAIFLCKCQIFLNPPAIEATHEAHIEINLRKYNYFFCSL